MAWSVGSLVADEDGTLFVILDRAVDCGHPPDQPYLLQRMDLDPPEPLWIYSEGHLSFVLKLQEPAM